MLVKIDINKLKSGKIQISMLRASQSSGPVQTYPSPAEAIPVLLALGIPATTINRQLEILADIGPKELLHFGQWDVADDVLGAHRFHP